MFFQTSKDQQSLNGVASGLFEVRVGPHPALAAGRHHAQPRAARRRGRAGAQRLDQRARGRGRGRERHHVADGLGGARHHAVRRGRTVPRRDLRRSWIADDHVRGGARFDLTPADLGGRGGRVRAIRFTGGRVRDANSWKVAPIGAASRRAPSSRARRCRHARLPPAQPTALRLPWPDCRRRLRFTIASVTRVDAAGDRDLVYSYDELQPYYLDSEGGARTTVSHHVAGPVDAIGWSGASPAVPDATAS